jgi:hypothetical protein
MNKTFSLDRFEEDLAVLIDRSGGYFHVLTRFLPSDAREGDLLALRCGKWTILREVTDERREELFDLQESLFGTRK